MIRALGFHQVVEVSFGADLVAREYTKLLANSNGHRYISTTCPAIVGYVERYYPRFDRIARADRFADGGHGPRDATPPWRRPENRLHRPLHRQEGRIAGSRGGGRNHAVLTFPELRRMCEEDGIFADGTHAADFDPPHGGVGGLFPVSRGMLQTAGLKEDLMTGEIVVTQGRSQMLEAVREFAEGDLAAQLLEVLCCEGCIAGPGIINNLASVPSPPSYPQLRLPSHCHLNQDQWSSSMAQMASLDLRRTYHTNDQRIATPAKSDLTAIMHRMGKFSSGDELNCGACGYDTCLEHAIAIYKNLAECEMCLPNTIDQLRCALKELEASHAQLATTQEALLQSEKTGQHGPTSGRHRP